MPLRSRVIWLLAGASLLVAVLLGAVHLLSERALHAFNRPVRFAHPIPSDSASIARGRHIARTRGCFGCHGQDLGGRVFDDEWEWVDRAVAPNLALHAREHDPAALEAAIRHGVGSDDRALWSMPSYNYRRLSDEDTAALIAFLRWAPVVSRNLPSPNLGFKARWAMLANGETHMAEWARQVPALELDPVADTLLARGEYLAMTTCNECHGLDLRGSVEPDFTTPDLAILSGYREADFRRLMREGVALGGRTDLGLMGVVAADRFAHFTDDELAALYAFLSTLPNRPIARNVFWRPTRE